ncbi:MAG: protein arginine kinase [Bacillota bacterium]
MDKKLLLSLDDKWMQGDGPHSDVVVSSRVRLARNLVGLPYPTFMKEDDFTNLFAQVQSSIEHMEPQPELHLMKDMNRIERQILVEKHLISPELAEVAKGAVVLNQDRSLSIMVAEEDHLRIQVIFPALTVVDAWKRADEIDDAMESKLDIAFNEKYGYLTACPTNVGTGLRASVMLHLPGLVLTKQASRILTALSQVGLVVRGIYGEGTEALGNLFQISNQITIGRTEEEIINNLYTVVLKIIDQERTARKLMMRETFHALADKVYRAYGILTNARVIDSEEAITLLSDLKLGIDLQILEGFDAKIFKQVMVIIQPAYLQHSLGGEISPAERDIKRAENIRQVILSSIRR